jgi:hypothetical protein
MTYDELRAGLSAYMKRTDPETIANEPTALELARLTIARVFYPVESEEEADLTLIDGKALLPADFGRAVAVGDDMGYVAPRAWRHMAAISPTRLGGKYSVYDGMLHTHGALLSVALVYNRQPVRIAAAATNWLAEFYPAIWMHAARAEQYRFIEDYEGAGSADAFWQGLAGQLGAQSEISRQSGGALRMKSR